MSRGTKALLVAFGLTLALGTLVGGIEVFLQRNDPEPALPAPQHHNREVEKVAEEQLFDITTCAVGEAIDTSLLDSQRIEQYFVATEITEGDEIYQRIYGKSFPTGGEIALSDLRYLRMLYVDYEGITRCGEMIVNAEISDVTLEIFNNLYREKYPICRMELIDNYWDGDGNTTDRKSILANNSSAFCYRTIAGTDEMSNHALGYAIDINPYDNPYVWRDANGDLITDGLETHEIDMLTNRGEAEHAITFSDEAYQQFYLHGFDWGGEWTNPLDYQHFEWRR
ncbi:MAG: M15 family metallopeptidase [Lachnospiraceae bacterium]|nr:M15 family metallopeptidase [Lachnospiraceae bacterium]